jgi:hypothetical protein
MADSGRGRRMVTRGDGRVSRGWMAMNGDGWLRRQMGG